MAAGLVFACLASFVALGVYLASQTFEPPSPINDPTKYAFILMQLGYPGRATLAHFPTAIPAAAMKVRLFYKPGHWQMPPVLLLRYELPENEFRSLTSSLPTTRPIAIEPGSLWEFPATGNQVWYGPGLPDGFECYLHVWGGEDTRGIAINKDLHEVLYWFQGKH